MRAQEHPMTDADTEARRIVEGFLREHAFQVLQVIGIGQDPRDAEAELTHAIAAALRARETQTVEALKGLRDIAWHIGEELQPDPDDAQWWQHLIDLRAALDAADRALAPLTPKEGTQNY